MKRTSKLLTALALACLLAVLSCAPAFAENGPFTGDFDGWAPTYLVLDVLDENEEPVTEINDGFEQDVMLPLYANKKATAQKGAVYDLETNTLTLTDFNKGNYRLEANMMGDDFTIEVKGDCRLSRINIWGDGWGGSLRITGDGSLTVNPNKKFESGVRFIPEGVDVTFTADPSVTLDIYGSKTAVEVFGADGKVDFVTGGSGAKLESAKAVREEFVMIENVYSNPWEREIIPGKNAADPDGVYDVQETDITHADGTEEHLVLVTRFFYDSERDLYMHDHEWAEGRDEKWSGSIDFPDMAAAEAAGFSQILDDNGEPLWVKITEMANHSSSETLYEDKDGNRYIRDYGFNDNGDFVYVAMTPEKVEGLDIYVCVPAPGVDAENLTEVKETHVYDDMFDYSFPAQTFTQEGASADFTPGDVNADGQVLANDARLALRASASLEKLDDAQTKAADVDEDGKVLANDARQILRFSAQLQTEFKKAAA